jgi:hypothetical protein
MKKNEILIYATIRINLESILSNQRSQSQRTSHYITPFYEML